MVFLGATCNLLGQCGRECSYLSKHVTLIRQEHVEIRAGQFNDSRRRDRSEKCLLPSRIHRASRLVILPKRGTLLLAADIELFRHFLERELRLLHRQHRHATARIVWFYPRVQRDRPANLWRERRYPLFILGKGDSRTRL